MFTAIRTQELLGADIQMVLDVCAPLPSPPDVIRLALPYSNLIFLLIPFTILLQVLSSILQGTGDTKTPMYAMIVVNLAMVFLQFRKRKLAPAPTPRNPPPGRGDDDEDD